MPIIPFIALFVSQLSELTTRREGAGLFSEYYHNGRTYKVYMPSGYQHGTALPLVVMLHGCAQNADDVAAVTRMNIYAEQQPCLVLYPDQSRKFNARKCWNWFLEQNQVRGRGEPAAIVDMVNQARQYYTVDPYRIYVAGISAGAALGVTLALTYPDIFAAIGVCSGVPYRAATNLSGAFGIMRRGVSATRNQSQHALDAMGSFKRTIPMILFHGNADRVVAPINARQLTSQWLRLNRLAGDGMFPSSAEPKLATVSASTAPGGLSYIKRSYEGPGGEEIVRTYMIDGMGHAWPGGLPGGSFSDPRGPDAGARMLTFFLEHPMPHAPTVIHTRPPQQPVAPPPAPPQPSPPARPPQPPPAPHRRVSILGQFRRILSHLASWLRRKQ